MTVLGLDTAAHEQGLVDVLSARPPGDMDDVLGMAMALCALGDTAKDAFALTAAA